MKSKLFFLGLTLLFQSAVAGAAIGATTGAIVEPADAPALAAHYRETIGVKKGTKSGQAADWYFSRRSNEIETARGEYAEVWKRDARGEVTLTRVFHADRKLIEYTSGELRTQKRYPDWTTLSAVLDPHITPALKPVGATSYLGRAATRYKGKLDGLNVEVVWLNRESLAAKIVRSSPVGKVTLELKELRAAPDIRWPQAGLDKAESYALLDGADLGDMEYDPFVQRVLGRGEGHGGHAHHH